MSGYIESYRQQQEQFTIRRTVEEQRASHGYASEMGIESYRKILSEMEEQKCKLQIHNMQGGEHTLALKRIGNLISIVKMHLKSDCCHEYVVNDYIELTPERGSNVTYCEKCYTTF